MNFKPKLSLYLALFLSFLVVPSCTHGGDSSASDSGELRAQAKPFLWSVEKGGRRSFLFGTVHIGVDAEKELPKAVWQRFDAQRCYVMEADQSAIDSRALISMATLPKGETLQSKVTPATWVKLREKLEPSIGASMLLQSRPWFAALVYMQELMPDGVAMDSVFRDRARAAGMYVDYLEDWREALGAFARVTDVGDLEDVVQNEGETEADTKALVQAYKSGDTARLESVMSKMTSETPNADVKTQALIGDRNMLWLPRLKKTIAARDCFVAVGAGHLVGKGNMRELMEKDGYTVKRVD